MTRYQHLTASSLQKNGPHRLFQTQGCEYFGWQNVAVLKRSRECVHVYTHLYIRVYVYVYTCIHICVYTRMCVYIYIYVVCKLYLHTHTVICVHMSICIHLFIRMFVYTRINIIS